MYCARNWSRVQATLLQVHRQRINVVFCTTVVYDRIEVFNSQVSPESTKAMSEWCMGQQKKKNKAFTVVV